jgi:hypothetical protein
LVQQEHKAKLAQLAQQELMGHKAFKARPGQRVRTERKASKA